MNLIAHILTTNNLHDPEEQLSTDGEADPGRAFDHESYAKEEVLWKKEST